MVSGFNHLSLSITVSSTVNVRLDSYTSNKLDMFYNNGKPLYLNLEVKIPNALPTTGTAVCTRMQGPLFNGYIIIVDGSINTLQKNDSGYWEFILG